MIASPSPPDRNIFDPLCELAWQVCYPASLRIVLREVSVLCHICRAPCPVRGRTRSGMTGGEERLIEDRLLQRNESAPEFAHGHPCGSRL